MPSHINVTDLFKKERRRQASLWRQLAKAPKGELVGVVRPRGVGGSMSHGDKQWTLGILLLAWRFNGGSVRHRELMVRKKVHERTMQSMMKKIGDYEIVRMEVRLAEKNELGTPQAQLERMLKPMNDPELAAAARKLKKPVRIKDPVFGSLTLNRSLGWYEGKATWRAGLSRPRRVEVTLGTDKKGSPEKSLQHARRLFDEQAEWWPQMMARIVKRLYVLWRDEWREDAKMLDERKFLTKMRLKTVGVETDGGVEFWFDDGDLFGGHSVVVSGKVGKGVKGADIQG